MVGAGGGALLGLRRRAPRHARLPISIMVGMVCVTGSIMRCSASHVEQPLFSHPDAYEMSPLKLMVSMWSKPFCRCVTVFCAFLDSPRSPMAASVYGYTAPTPRDELKYASVDCAPGAPST